jgi:hypothetical protein
MHFRLGRSGRNSNGGALDEVVEIGGAGRFVEPEGNSEFAGEIQGGAVRDGDGLIVGGEHQSAMAYAGNPRGEGAIELAKQSSVIAGAAAIVSDGARRLVKGPIAYKSGCGSPLDGRTTRPGAWYDGEPHCDCPIEETHFFLTPNERISTRQ